MWISALVGTLGNTCSSTWTTSFFPSFFLPHAAHRAISHPFPSLSHRVLPFLKYISPKAPSASLMASAVRCGGAVGATWSQPEPSGSGCIRHGAAPSSPHRAPHSPPRLVLCTLTCVPQPPEQKHQCWGTRFLPSAGVTISPGSGSSSGRHGAGGLCGTCIGPTGLENEKPPCTTASHLC